MESKGWKKDLIFNFSANGLHELDVLQDKTDKAKRALDGFNKSRKEGSDLNAAEVAQLTKLKVEYSALRKELKKHEVALEKEATGVAAVEKAINKKKAAEKSHRAAQKKIEKEQAVAQKKLRAEEKKAADEKKATARKEKANAKTRHSQLKKEAALRNKTAKATKNQTKNLIAKGIQLAVIVRAFNTLKGHVSESVKVFAEFEKGIKNVLTLMSDDEKGLLREDLWRGSLDIMKRYGIAAGDVNKALFNTVSAGVPAGEAIKFLHAASTLAIAGVTDLTSAQTGIVAVMNAYGKSAGDATRIAETLFTTQKFGVTTVEELSKSIGVVLPFAASAGISFEELGAAISVTTRSGLDAAKTVTALRAAISQMQNPAKESMHLFERFGIPVGAAEMKLIGFSETMRRLNVAYQENPKFVEKMFGNVRGLTAVLSIAGENMEMYNEQLEVYKTDTGEASSQQAAFNENMDSAQKGIDKMASAWTTFKISVGDSKMAMAAIERVTDLLTLFNSEDISNWSAFSAIINDLMTGGFFSDSIGVDRAMQLAEENKNIKEGIAVRAELIELQKSPYANVVGGMTNDWYTTGQASYKKYLKQAAEGDERAKGIIATMNKMMALEERAREFQLQEDALGFSPFGDNPRVDLSEVSTQLGIYYDLHEKVQLLGISDDAKTKKKADAHKAEINELAAISMAYRTLEASVKAVNAEKKLGLSDDALEKRDSMWTNFWKKPKGGVKAKDVNDVEIAMVEEDLIMVRKLLSGEVYIPEDMDAWEALRKQLTDNIISKKEYDEKYEALDKELKIYEHGSIERDKLKNKESALNVKLSKLQIDRTKKRTKKELDLYKKLFDALAKMASSWVNRAHENFMKKNQAEQDANQDKFDNGIISEARYNKEKDRLEKEAFEKTKKKEMALLTIAFARELAAIRMQSMAAPQNAVSAGLWGLTQAATLSVIATASYLSNMALVASQTMAQGGLVEGASHSQGGVKFALGGRVTELEGGEAVLNKRSTAMFGNTLSAMNVAGGGKSFSSPNLSGSSLIDYQALANAVSKNINVVLPVESFNRVNNKVQSIQSTNKY